jgi:hypothetical protein
VVAAAVGLVAVAVRPASTISSKARSQAVPVGRRQAEVAVAAVVVVVAEAVVVEPPAAPRPRAAATS